MDVIGNFKIIQKNLFYSNSISYFCLFYPLDHAARGCGEQSDEGYLSHSLGKSRGNEIKNPRCDGGWRGAKRTSSRKKSRA